jgi:hypothetical protein
VQASLKALVDIATDWCHIQLIDGKEYFRIVKNVEVYLAAKKTIQEKLNELTLERDRLNLITI